MLHNNFVEEKAIMIIVYFFFRSSTTSQAYKLRSLSRKDGELHDSKSSKRGYLCTFY